MAVPGTLRTYHLRALTMPCINRDDVIHRGVYILERHQFPRVRSVLGILFDPLSLDRFKVPCWWLQLGIELEDEYFQKLRTMLPSDRGDLAAIGDRVLTDEIGDKSKQRVLAYNDHELALWRPARDEEFACTSADGLPEHIRRHWWSG